MLLVITVAFLVAALPYGIGNPFAVTGLAIVAAIAERRHVRLDSNNSVTLSVLPTVFAAAVFGPLAAMFIAAFSVIGGFPTEFMTERPYDPSVEGALLRWGTYTSIRAIVGAAAGLAAVEAASHFTNATTAIVIATVTAALVVEPLDLILAAVTLRIRRGPASDSLRTGAAMLIVFMALYTPIVAALAVTYTTVSPWTLPLFLIPGLAAQRLFGLYQEQRQLAAQLAVANTDLEKANLSFATALVTTLDARDQYTAGHSAAVGIYAHDIAVRMGLSEAETRWVHLAGLVHDIGKIGLSPGLLEKPSALTLEERREMQRHSEIGERIVTKVDSYSEIASIVRHHHERVDGGGYPDGLVDEDIPLLSRIIAVADAYNAMTSNRPYRDAMPSRVARLRLAQAVDTQFDTSVVAAFEAVLAMANDPYRMARSPEFTFEWQQDAEASIREDYSERSSIPAFSISA